MRCILPLIVMLGLTGHDAAGQHPVTFEVRLLTVDANEGCDVGDIDGDGKLDVVAGRNWYRNGDWAPRPLRVIADWNGYVESNGDFLYDVNRDGRLDVIAGAFVRPEVNWYENPGADGLARGRLWTRRTLVDTGEAQNEASFLHDIDGDGGPEWITNSWTKDTPLVIWRFASGDSAPGAAGLPTLVAHTVGPANGHGLGFGDLDNDGREDILVGTGWYERPDGDPFAGPWTYHADWDRALSCPVLVRDLNGDGRNDVLWGNPHDFGVFAWLSTGIDERGAFTWTETEIDRSFSQPHCLAFADLDGDGTDELITGKRVGAHNGKDPGGTEPPITCYFAWDESAHAFERHDIAHGVVGIGLQIRTADLDGDGRVDIVVAGKDGTQVLFNRGN